MEKKEILNVLKDKRFQWIITIILFTIILFWSTNIRLSNWDLLNDQTTGEKLPSDLDAFYFLRVAETMVQNDGTLPEKDNMRYLPHGAPFTTELLPEITVFLYNFANFFGDYKVAEVNAFLPVLSFFIGLIFFFILSYLLTNSKIGALISSAVLVFIPVYLQRTISGFSDHDSTGIMLFFLVLIFFTYSFKFLNNEKRKITTPLLFGFATALLSTFAYLSWGGVNTYISVIFSLCFMIYWVSYQRHHQETSRNILLYFSSWIILTPLMGILFNFSPINFFKGFMLSPVGLITIFALLLAIIDFFVLKNIEKMKRFSFFKEKYSLGYSIIITILFGLILLPILGVNLISTLSSIWITIFHPWGLERITLTVAENAQPFLRDIMGMLSPIIFWMFVAGVITLGLTVFSRINGTKEKILANFFWLVLIFGSLFSRISPDSIMQGTNFISQVVYIVSISGFVLYFFWLYLNNKKIEVSPSEVVLLSLSIFILLTVRASMRHIFAITPLFCLFIGYLIARIYSYLVKNKGEIIKPVFYVLLILSLIGGTYSIYNFERATSIQAKQVGSSANYQWQNAMAWVRENTPQGAIVIHWWDYGYWVQYLGKRPSVTDGGHFIPFWDHLIGRYLLTTPDSNTAFSLMKTYNASYLLIDPTDLGKYPAYSIIGSDENTKDRYSAIPVMLLDSKQTVETANETSLVYVGGVFLDQDLSIELNGKKIFLPQERAVMAGVIWKMVNNNGSSLFGRPTGVFIYNNQRYDIPIRYVYINNQLIDSGNGVEAVLRIIPAFDGSQGINQVGSALYLSPKVAKGLFAQVYLLNNSFGNFSGIDIVHVEDDIVAQSLRQQGAPVDEFIYYGGFRGPIKIWKINYPDEVVAREEFLRKEGKYAEFDNLTFVK
jgi:asparagine N-glycosylation enzyme membrane subunit Stt3